MGKNTIFIVLHFENEKHDEKTRRKSTNLEVNRDNCHGDVNVKRRENERETKRGNLVLLYWQLHSLGLWISVAWAMVQFEPVSRDPNVSPSIMCFVPNHLLPKNPTTPSQGAPGT